MNKIYTFAIPAKKPGYITDARNPYEYKEVGEIEVYEGMTDVEFEAEKQNIGIPENAVIIATRLV